MFGIGMPEMIIILVIGLIVIGPQKLPELAKTLGKTLADFKKASEGFQQSVQEEANKATEPVKTAASQVNAPATVEAVTIPATETEPATLQAAVVADSAQATVEPVAPAASTEGLPPVTSAFQSAREVQAPEKKETPSA